MFERMVAAAGVVALMAAFLIVALGLRAIDGAAEMMDASVPNGIGALAEIRPADLVDFVLKLIPAVSIAVAAYFSVQSLRVWRTQLVGKRKFEVAEEALVAFERGKDAIEHARSPLVHKGEGATRKRDIGETDKVAERRDANFVPIERFIEQSEKFAPLRKTQLLCRHHFGPEAAVQFDTLFLVRREIINTAWVLNDLAEDEPQDLDEASRKFRLKARRVIWMSGDTEDEISKRISDAMARLEKILQPFLR